MTTHDNDRALLERARTGDQGAVEALLARHEEQIYRFGRPVGAPAPSALEACNEAVALPSEDAAPDERPLTVIVGVVAVGLAPLVWRFQP